MQLLIIFSDSLIKRFHFLCSLRTRSEKTRCSCKLLFCFAENKKKHVTFIIIWANKSLHDIANYSKVVFVWCLEALNAPLWIGDCSRSRTCLDHLGNVVECYLQYKNNVATVYLHLHLHMSSCNIYNRHYSQAPN